MIAGVPERQPETSGGGFDGASIVVTGGARGLGRGIARAFLHEGASVLMCDVNTDRLATTA